MAKKRSYSDEEKANALAALDANGGDLSRTARQIGVPLTTLADWAKGRVHPDVTEMRGGKRSGLADRLEDLAHALVDAIPGKVGEATLQQTAVSLGIAVEKMRLLRDQPTNIHGNELTHEERLAAIAALHERVRARVAGQPAAAGNGNGSGARTPQPR